MCRSFTTPMSVSRSPNSDSSYSPHDAWTISTERDGHPEMCFNFTALTRAEGRPATCPVRSVGLGPVCTSHQKHRRISGVSDAGWRSRVLKLWSSIPADGSYCGGPVSGCCAVN